jgi:hypothetical protein
VKPDIPTRKRRNFLLSLLDLCRAGSVFSFVPGDNANQQERTRREITGAYGKKEKLYIGAVYLRMSRHKTLLEGGTMSTNEKLREKTTEAKREDDYRWEACETDRRAPISDLHRWALLT